MQEIGWSLLMKTFRLLALPLCLILAAESNSKASFAKEVVPDKSKASTMPQYRASDLHLIYFRIEGTHCPICLARISGYIRNAEGIEMSEVSYHLPIEAVAVYDKSKINISVFFENIGKVENVKFVDVQDTTISELPKFIRPRPHKIESLLNPYMMP